MTTTTNKLYRNYSLYAYDLVALMFECNMSFCVARNVGR